MTELWRMASCSDSTRFAVMDDPRLIICIGTGTSKQAGSKEKRKQETAISPIVAI